jgi:hypothetical protein
MAYAHTQWTSALLAVLIAVAVIAARSAERDIYPAPEQAKIDLAAALSTAALRCPADDAFIEQFAERLH